MNTRTETLLEELQSKLYEIQSIVEDARGEIETAEGQISAANQTLEEVEGLIDDGIICDLISEYCDEEFEAEEEKKEKNKK